MAAYPNPQAQGRSLAGLFSDLFRETSTLVHEEAQLAKAEIAEKVSQLGTGAAAIAAGGAILFAGFIVLLFAAVNALALFLPPEHAAWLAPLIIGLIVMIAGYIALSKGRRELKAESLKPSRTMESLRRDTELVKGHLSTSRSTS
ncbi:MAG: phage holin family protein [Burkholderiales bacterium]